MKTVSITKVDSVKELQQALADVITRSGQRPEAIYIEDTLTVRLIEHKLSDSSKVYDVEIS